MEIRLRINGFQWETERNYGPKITWIIILEAMETNKLMGGYYYYYYYYY